MNVRNFFIFSLFFLLLLFQVFSADVVNSEKIYVSILEMNSYPLPDAISSSQISPPSSNVVVSGNAGYFFSPMSQNRALEVAYLTSTSTHVLENNSYVFNNVGHSWLQSINVCRLPSLNLDSVDGDTFELMVQSDFNYPDLFSPGDNRTYTYVNLLKSYDESILERNLYMKVLPYLKITSMDNSGTSSSQTLQTVPKEFFIFPKPQEFHQVNGNIDLYRYNIYGNDLVQTYFINELVNDLTYSNPISIQTETSGEGLNDIFIFGDFASKDFFRTVTYDPNQNKYIYQIMTGPMDNFFGPMTTTQRQELLEGKRSPYVLLTPNSNTIEFDISKMKQIIDHFGTYGDYQIQAYVIPLDGKCDFDQSQVLSGSEIQMRGLTSPQIINFQDPNIVENEDMETTQGNTINSTNDGVRIGDESIPPGRTYYNKTADMIDLVLSDGTTKSVSFVYQLNDSFTQEIYLKGNESNDTLEIRKDISLKDVVFGLSSIKRFKNDTQLKEEAEKTFDIMSSLNLNKELKTSYTLYGKRTNSKVTFYNVPESNRKNLTVYAIFNKEEVSDVRDIKILNDGGGKRFYVDADPIIGWYFNESEDNESIEYELPGDGGDGGTIIITEEPILFNEGNLIVTYREEGCLPNEAYLFDFDSLENSKVYSPGSNKFYKVCVDHITESLSTSKSNNYIRVLNYTNSSNVSLDGVFGNLEVYLSTINLDPIWDIKIQKENPVGDYSCLGSVNNEQNSFFGDCGYNQNNRIWIHLDSDTIPPTTTLNIPYLAHSIYAEIESVDNVGGSGVSSINYCIDEDNLCNPYGESGKEILGASGTIYLTCDSFSSCVRYVRFSATDNEGNVETVNSEEVRIIEKGSACSADCTANPAPGRYLKECNGLNSCQYYKYRPGNIFDSGDYVAGQCDYNVKGAYVYYNSTHNIQCPSGPFRVRSDTDQIINTMGSNCDYLGAIPYPIFFNGELITMKVLSCFRY